MKRIPPSKYFCFVVHLDGMEEAHDRSVYRKGVFKIAVRGIKTALEQGYRVTTNTTVFNGCDEEDLIEMFTLATEMGVEGCMVSPGYKFEAVPNQELFLSRKNARRIFTNILDPTRKIRFYNNPLYLDFLRGNREYQCTAYSNPTYTVSVWREPCYLLGDRHTQDVNDLFNEELWERYGVGKDPRCASCMMHCGFESATIFEAISSPSDIFKLIKEGAVPEQRRGRELTAGTMDRQGE